VEGLEMFRGRNIFRTPKAYAALAQKELKHSVSPTVSAS